MKKIETLKIKQESIKRQIHDNLDLLVGTVYRSPAMMNFSLTTKVNEKP
jgi:hypothetical protein